MYADAKDKENKELLEHIQKLRNKLNEQSIIIEGYNSSLQDNDLAIK